MTDRRTFLKSAGLLGAAAFVLSPTRLIAKAFSSSDAGKSGKGKKELELQWCPFEAKMKHVFTIANSSRTTTPIVLTRITFDGYTGYGEAAMPPYLGETINSAIDYLKKARPVLKKFKDPFMIGEIMAEMDAITTNNTAAKASIDIALHDLVGNMIGQPWWKIWGFNPANSPYNSFTVGLDTAEVVRKKAKEAAAEGNLIKVKLGRTEEQDKMMINTIREVTDTTICIDANQGWKDKFYALDMINWLNTKNVCMIEQPMPKLMLEEAGWLTERSPLPIMADEACQRLSDVRHLYGHYSGINIKLMKCTGMHEAREMVSLAQALNMKIMVGCMTETSVAIAAGAQFAPVCQWTDLDGNWLIANDCFHSSTVENGRIIPSPDAGLGLKMNKGVNLKYSAEE